MKVEDITNFELQNFCEWFKDHYSKNESYESAMITCLCGHYHTYPREAKRLLKRLISLKYVSVRNNIVYLK